MSYGIYIGQAVLEEHGHKPDDYDGQLVAEYVVKGTTSADAPVFPHDEMTGNGNSRHPGYSQWGEFCREAGLEDLFFGKWTGLMRRHPGCFALKPEHLASVRAAREAWERAHPGAVPGWDFDPVWRRKDEEDDGVRGRDGILARLLWLEWWMAWALGNCDRPAIYNR